jgi:small subunit ribosomal protein S4
MSLLFRITAVSRQKDGAYNFSFDSVKFHEWGDVLARKIGPSCRVCRTENLKLNLKGERCFSDKCSFERRPFSPGQHGQSKFKKLSDYAVQLREKQKVKRYYGVLEKQFRHFFAKAEQQRGVTGELLLSLLERRLDNVLFRAGLAYSRSHARQLIRHNHVLVNNKRVNIPSCLVSVASEVVLRDKIKTNAQVQELVALAARREVPHWLEVDLDAVKVRVKSMPAREDIALPIQEQLIVELFSK